jgi:hypothetical protein
VRRLTTPCCKNPSQPSAHRTAGALVALRARVALPIHEGWRTTMARLDSNEACGALGPGDDARALPAFLTLLTLLTTLDALAWWLRGADFLPPRVRVFFVELDELGEGDDLIMVEPLVGGPPHPSCQARCQQNAKKARFVDVFTVLDFRGEGWRAVEQAHAAAPSPSLPPLGDENGFQRVLELSHLGCSRSAPLRPTPRRVLA